MVDSVFQITSEGCILRIHVAQTLCSSYSPPLVIKLLKSPPYCTSALLSYRNLICVTKSVSHSMKITVTAQWDPRLQNLIAGDQTLVKPISHTAGQL